MFVIGPGSWWRLNALNAEALNSKYRVSSKWKSFKIAMSSLTVPGPRSVCNPRRCVAVLHLQPDGRRQPC